MSLALRFPQSPQHQRRLRRHDVRVVKCAYQLGQAQTCEAAVEQFTSVDVASGQSLAESLFTTDFTAYADGVCVVNDLTRDQFLSLNAATMSQPGVELREAYYAMCDRTSAFSLLCGTWKGNHVAMLRRIVLDQNRRQIDLLWGRGGILPRRGECILKDPGMVEARQRTFPRLRAKQILPDARTRANMLATMDSFITAMNTWSDTERQAHVESFMMDDFQAWDGTGVWAPLSDAARRVGFSPPHAPAADGAVLDRAAFSNAMGVLNRALGARSGAGRLATTVRGRGTSATHNLGFIHFDMVGVAEDTPLAFDVLAAFVFTSDGLRMKQALSFRSCSCVQEYASLFHMDADLANVAEG